MKSRNRIYRLTQMGDAWHLLYPDASLAHAFTTLDEALLSVEKDRGGATGIVELFAGSMYMVKELSSPCRGRAS
jgi:hypothetical protein